MGIVERNRPFNRVGPERRETLHHPQLVAGAAIRRLVREVGGLDHQGRPLPVAAGVADVLPDRRREVRTAIERDDPRVVHHLVGDGHVPGRLVDVVRVAVDRRHHRAGHAARDAPVVEAPVLPRVRRAPALACGRAGGRTLLGLGRLRRHLPVRRIGHQPGAAVHRVVVLEPVHRAGGAGKLAQRRRPLDSLPLALFDQLGQLLRRHILQPPAGKGVGALERDAALVAVVVVAGDVRIAPGRSGRHIGPARRQGRYRLLLRHLRGGDRLGTLRGLRACQNWRGQKGENCSSGN